MRGTDRPSIPPQQLSRALPITEAQRLFRWPEGSRPDEHPGLAELGL